MARRSEHETEIAQALRRDAWSLTGPTRIVKVVPAGGPTPPTMRGHVCLEKALFGKTPTQIAAWLGLRKRSLDAGCRVFRLKRLPMAHEVSYELTARHPDGSAFDPVMHDAAYPPGHAGVHQWRLLADMPVEHLLDLLPRERYPYRHPR